ncbi:hypothetical protein CISIN_1g039947mg [Citrus sinensis]|uniref:Uncharacterized protein n=1 Tax=Citrus sinensis TaxID=2711 RepID=A0A067F259_CITSI|nr:hypothetical protein CISIN_1g039947mg [Citrus sinensis]
MHVALILNHFVIHIISCDSSRALLFLYKPGTAAVNIRKENPKLTLVACGRISRVSKILCTKNNNRNYEIRCIPYPIMHLFRIKKMMVTPKITQTCHRSIQK